MIKKFTKHLCIGTAVLAVAFASNNAFASDGQGDIYLTIRAQGAFPVTNKQTFNQKSIDGRTGSAKKLLNSGFGGEVAATYFVTSNVAIEGAVGITRHKVKNIGAVRNLYKNDLTTVAPKAKSTYLVPVKLTAQYYVLPDNSMFSPYLGAGYHYAFTTSSPKGVKINNAHGPVLQAGVDVEINDRLGFNINVDQCFRKFTAKYHSTVSDTQPLKGKYKMNPVTVGAGISILF